MSVYLSVCLHVCLLVWLLCLSACLCVETGDYTSSLPFECVRKKINNWVMSKKSGPITTRHMGLAIPTNLSPRSFPYANLTLKFIPYVEEKTKWPDRFCRLSVYLKIPPRCVVALPVNHSFSLTLTVHISSSDRLGERNDLLDGQQPLQFVFPVLPEGASELVELDCRTVRQTTLFDTNCQDVKFEIFGKLDLKEVPMLEHHIVDHSVDEYGDSFAEIVAND